MRRKILGTHQRGSRANWIAITEAEKPSWLDRVSRVTANTKCYTCNKQAKELCHHCRYAYCIECMTKHKTTISRTPRT